MWGKRSATFRYTAYGVLFGFLFPVSATLGDVLIRQLPLTLESLVQVQGSSPLHWMIDTAPFFLGLFASFAGRRQDQLLQSTQKLEQESHERELAVRQLEILRTDLKQKIAARTADLTTVIEVGRAAASILDLETLVRTVVELVRERFDLYYAGLFLLDDAGQYAVLEAGTGEAGRLMKERGHKLEVGGRSMVGAACAVHRARIAMDVGVEPVRFDNPLLPDTRSEMALPLMVADRVLGALDVQSTAPAAFSEDDIAILQLVANQVAVAVDNARKFSEEAALLEATSPLYRASRRLANALTTDEIVQAISSSVAETDVDGCTVARFGFAGGTGARADQPETITFLGTWNREGAPRFPTGVPFPVSASHLPLPMIGTFLAVDDIVQETRMPEESRQFLIQSGSQALVNIPLRAGGRVIGFVLVQRATPGPFSPIAIRLYETLVDQAAVALERARLLEETQRQAWREHTIREIADQVSSSFDLDTILRTAMDQLGTMIGASGGYAELGEEPRRVCYRWGPPDIPDEAWRAVLEDAGMSGTAASGLGIDGRHLLGVPVKLRNLCVGALGFHRPVNAGPWRAEEIVAIETVADRLALTFDNARLLAETQDRVAQERLISEVTARMRETLDVDIVLRTAIREMGMVLGLPKVEVRMGKGTLLKGPSETGVAENGHAPRRVAE